LGELLGTRISFHPTMALGQGEYGIGVGGAGVGGSGFTASQSIELPTPPGEEPRALLRAESGGVTFICTHLSLDEGARELQTEALAGVVREVEGPVVLLGDLNQGRSSLRPLLAAGLRPGPGRPRTHSSTLPWHQIDWVLAGGGAEIVAQWALGSRASDHRPLVATVRV
jgi:endonuclease/exonuclease/phosphatase family metal-dependent hydrolase